MININFDPILKVVFPNRNTTEATKNDGETQKTSTQPTIVSISVRTIRNGLIFFLIALIASFTYLELRHRTYSLARLSDHNEVFFNRCGNDSCVMGIVEMQDNPSEETVLRESEEPKDIREAASWFAREHNLVIRGIKLDIEREVEVKSPNGIIITEPYVYEVVLQDSRNGDLYELDLVRWTLENHNFIDRVAGAIFSRYDYSMFPEEFEKQISLNDLKIENPEAYEQLEKELANYSVTTESVLQIELSDRESSRKPGTTFVDKNVSFEVKFLLPNGKIHEIIIDSIV